MHRKFGNWKEFVYITQIQAQSSFTFAGVRFTQNCYMMSITELKPGDRCTCILYIICIGMCNHAHDAKQSFKRVCKIVSVQNS